MTARQVFEATLIELSKIQAPALKLYEFNYLFNKAINQYINKVYNALTSSIENGTYNPIPTQPQTTKPDENIKSNKTSSSADNKVLTSSSGVVIKQEKKL